MEEAVDVAEEKLLSGRQPHAEHDDDRDAQELQRRELQAWDERLEEGSEQERDTG